MTSVRLLTLFLLTTLVVTPCTSTAEVTNTSIEDSLDEAAMMQLRLRGSESAMMTGVFAKLEDATEKECPSGGDLTEDECKQAADQLGYTYSRHGKWSSLDADCAVSIKTGKVYYNKHRAPRGSSKYAPICETA